MKEQTTREAFALNNTITAVKIEANALYGKHGPMPAEVEDIRFHVQRAMHTLEAALYAYPWDAARILDRLEHLGAVCVRSGVAVRELQAAIADKEHGYGGTLSLEDIAGVDRYAPMGIPGACPHGSNKDHCADCGKPICNLCGLWVAHGNYYCSEHKKDDMAMARGL